MAQKTSVLSEHCERLDRDPDQIQRSIAALLFLCDDDEQAAKLKAKDLGRPSLIGTVAQLQEQIGQMEEMGVDEIIIPDFNLSDSAHKDDVADRFISEVAAQFR